MNNLRKDIHFQTPPLPSNYSSDLCLIVQSMLELEPEKRPSAQRLLRHSYIRKQIALFLEGTKNRQVAWLCDYCLCHTRSKITESFM